MAVSLRIDWRPRKKDEQRAATTVFSSGVGGGVWLHSSLALANVLVNTAALRCWQPIGMVLVVARGQSKKNLTKMILFKYYISEGICKLSINRCFSC